MLNQIVAFFITSVFVADIVAICLEEEFGTDAVIVIFTIATIIVRRLKSVVYFHLKALIFGSVSIGYSKNEINSGIIPANIHGYFNGNASKIPPIIPNINDAILPM